ncbi:hypothetical protein DSO57_1017490 [Entomophthora muscae]|uniref:Uncharacterized protein n=1 Tax=Entomophthora muscae TaxID=34485 RepID=A0ACC2TS75_9FUNG|nr:hypothetical protein DSO57_1017490 [Entomophthora muscae]
MVAVGAALLTSLELSRALLRCYRSDAFSYEITAKACKMIHGYDKPFGCIIQSEDMCEKAAAKCRLLGATYYSCTAP